MNTVYTSGETSYAEVALTLVPLLILIGTTVVVVYALKLFKTLIRYYEAKTEYYKNRK